MQPGPHRCQVRWASVLCAPSLPTFPHCTKCDGPLTREASGRGSGWVCPASQPKAGRNKHATIQALPGDLRQHSQALTTLVYHDPSIPSIQHAVLSTAKQITASPDWFLLQKAFATARSVAASSAQAPRNAAGRWGFALRQPGKPAVERSSLGCSAGSTVTQSLPVQQAGLQTPHQLQCDGPNTVAAPPCWDWQDVQHFRILGLGSIMALLAAPPQAESRTSTCDSDGCVQATSTATPPAQQPSGRPGPPPRLGFRLMQLSLAVALSQHLMQSLTGPPLAFDTEFEAGDVQLLTRLGFEVPPAAPRLALEGPSLLYMPCCPRQLYGDVMAANWSQLPQVAILGTSMRSLSESQSLFSALVQEGDVNPRSGPNPQTGDNSSSSRAGPTNFVQLQQPQMQQQRPEQAQAAQSMLQLQQQQQQQLIASDTLSAAFQQGRVVEVMCPDCSAHGVAVALHVFRPL